MEKGKLKKYITIAVIAVIAVIICITYYFLLDRNQSIGISIGVVMRVLRPLIIGAIIAYILKSTANFFEKHLMKLLLKSGKRSEKAAHNLACGLGVLFTYIIWGAAVSVLLIIAIPQVIQSVTDFINMLIVNVPIHAHKAADWLETLIDEQQLFAVQFEDIVHEAEEWISTTLSTENLTTLASEYATKVITMVSDLISVMIDFVIGLVISVFILLGRHTLAKKSMLLLHCIFKKEKTVDVIADEFKYADRMFSGFLEGKVLDSSIIALLYYIFLELVGIPYPPLIAVICGVTNIIPIFGPFIGAIPSGLIIVSSDPSKLIPFIIFVCVIQFIDGYIIDPHIVGGNIKISSFCVVFAVITFGGLWGFMGLLVGVPTFAVIYDIFRKLSLFILKKRGKQDLIAQFKRETSPEKKKKPDKQVSDTGDSTSAEAAPVLEEADEGALGEPLKDDTEDIPSAQATSVSVDGKESNT